MDHATSAKSVSPNKQIDSILRNIEDQTDEVSGRVSNLLTRLRGPQPSPASKADTVTSIQRSVVDRTENIRSTMARIMDMLGEVETLV